MSASLGVVREVVGVLYKHMNLATFTSRYKDMMTIRLVYRNEYWRNMGSLQR